MRSVSRGQVTMRYESLVSAPTHELARATAGEAPQVAGADLARFGAASIAVGVQHSVAGNPVRMREGGVTLRADEEWRTAMSPADRRTVSAVAWPLLLRYGYPLGARNAHTVA
jgi:hypothetical protein